MSGAASQRPIGVFDSGVGGLTVCHRIMETMPAESLVYLGDTARVPYGSKSAATVVRYALGCAELLVKRDIKLLVVACNTASAFALDALRASLPIPVVGVIEPGARAACKRTENGRIGVIGTRGVIGSEAYVRSIQRLRPDSTVYGVACPLFVPFAEEGWTSGEAILNVAQTYLSDLLINDIDTLVLGCTHYPLLRDVIGAVAGSAVQLVDSAEETAAEVARILSEKELRRTCDAPGMRQYLVSDAPELFMQTGMRFLKRPIDHVEWVDVCI